jgi:hypothetical protein
MPAVRRAGGQNAARHARDQAFEARSSAFEDRANLLWRAGSYNRPVPSYGSLNRMLLLGCIADDFTGATDLANALVAGGLPTELRLGIPERPAEPGDAPRAVVLALKSRTAPVAEAVRDSVAAARWLMAGGARSSRRWSRP